MFSTDSTTYLLNTLYNTLYNTLLGSKVSGYIFWASHQFQSPSTMFPFNNQACNNFSPGCGSFCSEQRGKAEATCQCINRGFVSAVHSSDGWSCKMEQWPGRHSDAKKQDKQDNHSTALLQGPTYDNSQVQIIQIFSNLSEFCVHQHLTSYFHLSSLYAN